MSTASRIAMVIIGFVLLMVGLWGGSYLLSVYPHGSDYNFAAFFTSCIVSLLGFGLIVGAVVGLMP